MPTYECVGMVKKYMLEVLGMPYRYFGTLAINGWKNTSNTFPPELWDRVEKKPGLVPPRGAIIFYAKPVKTGHVAVVHNANKIFIVRVEQNFATGNGKGNGYDQINMNVGDYRDVLGWYVKKKI